MINKKIIKNDQVPAKGTLTKVILLKLSDFFLQFSNQCLTELETMLNNFFMSSKCVMAFSMANIQLVSRVFKELKQASI